MTEQRYVSTATVARALGVSVTTVKRWVDDAILPAHKTAGGHRKLLLADVLELTQRGSFPKLDLAVLGGCSTAGSSCFEVVRQELYDAMMRGEGGQVRAVLHGAYRTGVAIETLADEVIAPALRRVGQDWNDSRVEVHEEHRGTQLCAAALYELKALLEVNARVERPLALGGAPEHDHYLLPSLLAQMVLLSAGWRAVNLGPHTPMSSLRRALSDLRPKLIWVSVSHLVCPESFLGDYAEFYRDAQAADVPVAVGGRGLTEAVRARMQYTAFGDGLTHLAAFAHTLHPTLRPPRRGRPKQSRTATDPDPRAGE